MSDDRQKQALLLHMAGMDVQEIYNLLVGENEKSYDKNLHILDANFIPICITPFERHLFRQVTQNEGETGDSFVCRLHRRAAICDFGDHTDDYIRDQIIDKCSSAHLRRKFLERKDLNPNSLLETARAHEAVERQAKTFETSSVSKEKF